MGASIYPLMNERPLGLNWNLRAIALAGGSGSPSGHQNCQTSRRL